MTSLSFSLIPLFCRWGNGLEVNIKLDFQFHENFINFLDITVYVTSCRTLAIKSYHELQTIKGQHPILTIFED